MHTIKSIFKIAIIIVALWSANSAFAQQDPQYTQYMYNTMVINPAYTGSKGYTTITGLARTQWVGLDGAPDTQTLSYDSQLGYSRVGLGFTLINDEIGPSQEIYIDGNISYSIEATENGNLSFGLKLGGRFLSVDPSKGMVKDEGDAYLQAINSKFLPTIGAGLYYYTDKFYIGASIPNFIRTEHYDDTINNVGVERFHLFGIVGYVFDLSENVKFKPASIVKAVPGAPLSLDISANFLFNERFTAGLAWRWDDSIAGLLGFQVTEGFYIGYSYDLTTSNYSNYNSGTHEVLLRLNIFREGGIISPRFF